MPYFFLLQSCQNVSSRDNFFYFSPFATMFQLSWITILSFIVILPYFCIDVFKVVFCNFVVCGKGLKRLIKASFFLLFLQYISYTLNLSLIQQICSKQPSKHLGLFMENLYKEMFHYWKEFKMWQKMKLLIMNNFSFCHNILKSRLLRRHHDVSIFGKRLKLYLQSSK